MADVRFLSASIAEHASRAMHCAHGRQRQCTALIDYARTAKSQKMLRSDNMTPPGMQSPTAITRKTAEAFREHEAMVRNVISVIGLPPPGCVAKSYGTEIQHAHGGLASFLDWSRCAINASNSEGGIF
jgi:hypothetical protein